MDGKSNTPGRWRAATATLLSALLSWGIAANAATENAVAGTPYGLGRVLHFPADRTLGDVYVRDTDAGPGEQRDASLDVDGVDADGHEAVRSGSCHGRRVGISLSRARRR